MNNERRKRLKASIQLLHQSSEILVDVVTDEEDTLNGMPESLSHTERYQSMECAVDSLDKAIEKLDQVIELVEDAME